MNHHLRLLDVIDVASPCHVPWDQMNGDDKMRHCGQCDMTVYNLSGMTRDEATRLVSEREGRLCIRLYRRSDGTLLTNDCPIGLRAVRRRLARIYAAVAALIAFLAGGAAFARRATLDSTHYASASGPIDEFAEWLDPTPQSPAIMGFAVIPSIQRAAEAGDAGGGGLPPT